MLMRWDAVLSVLWSLHSYIKIHGEKTAFLFSFHGYSPCSLFMANKHIWIGNDSKYCFMQRSSRDAVLHMQTDEIVIKRGEEKEKLGSLIWLDHTVQINKDSEVILITSYSCCFSLSFFLLPPSLSFWLIQQDAGNYSHLRGQQERRDGMQSVRTWQEKTTERHWRSSYFKGTADFFSSPASSPYSALSPPLSVLLKGTPGCCRNATSTCIPISARTAVRRRGVEWFTYVDQRVASCQRSWLKFLGPRMQGVMYDEQVVWV